MKVTKIRALVTFGLIVTVVTGGLAVFRQEGSRAHAAPPSEEEIYFAIDVTGDMLLIGAVDPDTGDLVPGPAVRSVGGNKRTKSIGIAPGGVFKMPFLNPNNDPEPRCFLGRDDNYNGGLIIFFNSNGTARRLVYFFSVKDSNDDVHHYQLRTRVINDDIELIAGGLDFPDGDSYTVQARNFEIIRDMGGLKACEGYFPDTIATITLVRHEP